VTFHPTRKAAQPRVRAHALVGVMMVGVLAGPARAEPVRPTVEEDTNPLVPLIRDLGRRLGLDLDAEQVALNPFKGSIVLRGLKAASASQGEFLAVDRLEITGGMQQKSQVVDEVVVGSASISLDLGQPGLTPKLLAKRHDGKVKQATLEALSVRLRAGSTDLVRGEGLAGTATNVEMCETEGTEPICAGLSVTKGTAELQAMRVEDLALTGSIKGHRLSVTTLTGTLGGGTFMCSGPVVFFSRKGRGGTDLACTLDRVRITRADVLDVVVSGKVRLEGAPVRLKLTGVLDAKGGKTLRSGRWGARDPRHPIDVGITIKVNAPRGKAEARVVFAKGVGQVVISGTKGRDPAAVDKMLELLDETSAGEGERP